ncbi:MAG: hypothetical protein JXR68_13145 [Bacteroidales bacterium]|nr:hypothetical protein [Bacteroidales bacterium]
MKFNLLFIFSILFLFACGESEKKTTPEEIIEKYYSGLNEANFNVFSEYLSDSIIFQETDFVLASNKEEFKTNFDWDVTFEPKYEILEIKNIDDKYEVTLSKNCKRIELLQDTVMVYKTIFDISNEKIDKIVISEFVLVNFELWMQRRDSLENWINENHPELSGFVFDQTQEGAENYLKAINLFENFEVEVVKPRNCEHVPLRVYLSDPDESGTNIRKSPGGEIILTLVKDDEDFEFFITVTEAQNGWFKIQNPIVGMENNFEIPGGKGWIHGSVIAVDTRNYGGQKIEIWSEPGEGKIIGYINEEAYNIGLKDLYGNWAKIEYKGIEGWVKIDWLCGNPLTNCC